jgi:DNA-binding transcriptional ArsR family regulator
MSESIMDQASPTRRLAPIKRAEVLRPLQALADDTRLRILEMLAEGGEGSELRAQDLISQLGSSQPNVSRHLKQLVAAGLVDERRAGDANKWYRLNLDVLARMHQQLAQLLTPENARAIREMEHTRAQMAAAQQTQPPELRGLLDAQGRVPRWPNKRKDQEKVLSYLVTRLAPGYEYTEKALGETLKQWFLDPDVASLRRDMFELGLINRTSNGSKYWRVI